MNKSEDHQIMPDMNDINIEMDIRREKSAPTCHFRKMFYNESDSIDMHYEEWFECSVCGHTKSIWG